MKVFWLVLLSISSIFSQSSFDLELPISDVEKGLPTLVAGCVNVISGDYIDQAQDLFVRGPIPLSYERFYSSADYLTRSLFCGWRHNHDAQIETIYGKDKSLALYGDRR